MWSFVKYRVPYVWIVLLETLTTTWLLIKPHQWVTVVGINIVILVLLLWPISNIPTKNVPAVLSRYWCRKLYSPQPTAYPLEQNHPNTPLVLYHKNHCFFALEVTPLLDTEEPDWGFITDLLNTPNRPKFFRIHLLTIYTTPNTPPTRYLYFYLDLAHNVNYFLTREKTPTNTIFYNIYQHLYNQLLEQSVTCKPVAAPQVGELFHQFYPDKETPTYVRVGADTLTFYTTNTRSEVSLLQRFPPPLTLLSEYTPNGVAQYVAGKNIRGALGTKTRLEHNTWVKQIRHQQSLIASLFTPTPVSQQVKGTRV